METATKNLENDHVHILRLIDIMEKSIESEETDSKNIETMINLIRNYLNRLNNCDGIQ